jgi:hypothetical protein
MNVDELLNLIVVVAHWKHLVDEELERKVT